MSNVKKVQTAVRLDASQISEAEALVKKLSQPGLALTRADVIRMALAAGLKELRQRSRAA